MLVRQQNDQHYFSPNPSAQEQTTTDPNPGDEGEEDSSDSRDSISDTLNPQQVKQLSNTLKILQRDISYFEDYNSLKKIKVNHKAENSIRVAEQKQELNRYRIKDKSDRATTEQVLDNKTLNILHKFQKREVFHKLQHCISTGKEANVYQAIGPSSEQKLVAIKIYKTSILIFKDRQRYVMGQFRFRNRSAKGNPRQMVQLWAEKQMRNLLRISKAEQRGYPIRCPKPIVQKRNILVMQFLGDLDNQIPAPRLKDAKIESKQQFVQAYHQVIIAMRVLYQQCHLVHADLSEYNILYWNSNAYIIDVSQSVQNDHPMSMDFLRRDCANVNSYFAKIGGVDTLTLFGLFKFITKYPQTSNIDGGNEPYEQLIQQQYKQIKDDEIQNYNNIGQKKRKLDGGDDQIFKNMYLPCNTADFDISKLARGCLENQDLINQHIGVYQREYQMPFNPSDLPKENKGRIKLLIKRLMNYQSRKDDNKSGDDDDDDDDDEQEEELESGESSDEQKQRDYKTQNNSKYQSKYNQKKKFVRIDKKEFDTESPGSSKDQQQSDQLSSNFTGRQTSYDQIKEQSDCSSSSSSDDDREITIKFQQQKFDMYEGLSKKERKQKVKEEKRQKREQKIPKHIKKRAVKKAHNKKK